MRTLVKALATAVRRAPWIVIAVVIVMSMILGGLASKFVPADDQNESFAPDAPELSAAAEISETFGVVSSMQVVVSSSTGDVITLDGLGQPSLSTRAFEAPTSLNTSSINQRIPRS